MELVVNIDETRNRGAGGKPNRFNAAEFDSAELRAGPTFGQGLYLFVSGPAPKNGLHVKLLPELNESNPEYRRIEIVADTPANDHDLPEAADRYEKSMPLTGLSGTRGIELVGANGKKRFDLVTK